jgi:hypothetical protein
MGMHIGNEGKVGGGGWVKVEIEQAQQETSYLIEKRNH